AVVLAERLHLGIEIGIIPVGFRDFRSQIVNDQSFGDAAEMPEGVLQATQEVLGGLSRDRFGVAFARVTQDDAEDVRPTAAALRRENGAPTPKSTCASSPGPHSMRRNGNVRLLP